MGNLLPSLGRRKLPMLEMPKVGGGGGGAIGSIVFAPSLPDPTFVPADGRIIPYPSSPAFNFSPTITAGGVNKKANPASTISSRAVVFFKGRYYAANEGGILLSADGETFAKKTDGSYTPTSSGSSDPRSSCWGLAADANTLFYGNFPEVGRSADGNAFTANYTAYGTGRPGTYFKFAAANGAGAILCDTPQKAYGFWYGSSGALSGRILEDGDGPPYWYGVCPVGSDQFLLHGQADQGYSSFGMYGVGQAGLSYQGGLTLVVNGFARAVAYAPATRRYIAAISDGSLITCTGDPLVTSSWTTIAANMGYTGLGACFHNGMFYLCGQGGKVSVLSADGTGLTALTPYDTTDLYWIGGANNRLFTSGAGGFIGEVIANQKVFRTPSVPSQYSAAGQPLNAYMKVA